jgi:uncharacterized membrane protein
MILAWIVLGAAISGLTYALISFAVLPESRMRVTTFERLAPPLLALVGLGVAAYLSYIELSGSEAFCGPIGGCDVVQASRFSRLFGLIPLGLVGAAGYAFILIGSLASQASNKRNSRTAQLAIFAAALFGTAFSLYLTCIEIFVLRAACIWCLSSAVIITLILAISARPAAAGL